MRIIRRSRLRVLWRLFASVLFCLLPAFLVYQIIGGGNGWHVREDLKQNIAHLEAELLNGEDDIARLNNLISLLSAEEMSMDLATELLRREVYLMRPDEYLVRFPRTESTP